MRYEDKPWEYGPRKPVQSDDKKDHPWKHNSVSTTHHSWDYYHQKKFDFDTDGCFIKVIIVAAIIAVLFFTNYSGINKVTNYRHETVTVTDKAIKRHGSDDDKYLIYTELENGDISVYEITDSLFAGRFDSSDLYASIEVGKTYDFYVAGKRVPFLSLYPNVYEVREIK